MSSEIRICGRWPLVAACLAALCYQQRMYSSQMRIRESPVRLPMMNTPGAISRFSRALSRSDWPESISESSAGSHSSWRSASLRYFKEPRRPLTYANPLTVRSIRLPSVCCNVTMAKLPCRRTSTIAVFGNPSWFDVQSRVASNIEAARRGLGRRVLEACFQ
jgi:hypothetical protein